MGTGSRRLIAAGYLVPAGLVGASLVGLPRGLGLGGAAAMVFVLLAAGLVGAALLLGGTLSGLDDLRWARREGRPCRWQDLALLAGGALPFVAAAVAAVLS
jgi:hypothetical protein